jgi:hypothetical protein
MGFMPMQVFLSWLHKKWAIVLFHCYINDLASFLDIHTCLSTPLFCIFVDNAGELESLGLPQGGGRLGQALVKRG